jgi:hypothetical protein
MALKGSKLMMASVCAKALFGQHMADYSSKTLRNKLGLSCAKLSLSWG